MSVYPATDLDFKQSVETALAKAGGRQVDDPGVLAAAMAMVQTSYPTVTLQVRRNSQARENSVEAFRDADVLDRELARRARAGDELAMGQLYDRHQRLVYAIAVQTAPELETAAAAAVSAFRAVLAAQPEHPPMRVRLALAARDAALRAAGTDAARRSTLQRAVIELAHGHGLSATEIALVLGLGVPAVRMLATEGLQTVRLRPDGYRSALSG